MFDRPLKILVVSSEVVPFAKTGGLADVAGSLPKALAVVGNDNMGNDVRIAMPRYQQIEAGVYRMDFPVPFKNRNETAIIREASIESQYQGERKTIPVYLVDNHHYFYRDRMYMYEDEAERFTFFCRAVLEMLPKLDWQPDVIHCNDWQSGPIPLFLKTHYRQDQFYNRIATVFTIHNLQYQGNYPKDVLRVLGLGEEFFHPERLEFYGMISFIKAGIVYSDVINTVSRTYASEIQRPELGERMDGLLRKRSKDLYGIVNGINYHEFNPKTDPRIHRNFDSASTGNKKENKYALQKEMNLPVKDVPLIGLISRLVDQKGLDLISEIIDEMMSEDLQFVVLGSGDKYYENMFERIRSRYPDKMGLYLGFNAILAQRIYAGSDMFLMPSRFEPCGLGQLISLRYGTIPIVRLTGGLADTVSDYNQDTGSGNGFGFSDYSGRELLSTIKRSVELYREKPAQWESLIRRAMEQDFSWARSGVEYLQLYQQAMSTHLSLQRIA
ncbi:glycogen synthase GlgA [Pelotomaculum propionicicum]|uniref:Glycogen synthase n=1 Tax=Pelotomaculum propionicicum TaxID=258475 RepID=A0A4Y7RUA3_9FIRM|nr:glycogen synthase GlgA [Pelotomaculum propionicicum]NLI14348.1 glycogen synthase GlgA [Peptococcaceae bacterium]TEB12555.1 Glycogen synthase [Pelotomaculum propionicicum]